MKKLLLLLCFVFIDFIFLAGALPSEARPATQQASNSNPLIQRYLPMVQRILCGELTADTTWTMAASPYRITCDLTVPAGLTLSIEAGVTVQFQHPEDDLIIHASRKPTNLMRPGLCLNWQNLA